MPELPEVETVKEILKSQIIGYQIKNVNVLYDGILETPKNDFVNSLVNKTILDINRRGKFLIFKLDDCYMVSHLRMEGKYFIKPSNEEIVKHEHVIFEFTNGMTLRYHDTRKFGIMLIKHENDLFNTPPLSKLGYEPFDDALTPEYLLSKYSKLKKTIKEALLDQSIMAGLGNIYVDEVCFLSHINPRMLANNIDIDDAKSIITNSRNVLNKAILAGGTTIRSYTSSLGVTGRFQLQLLVHSKEGEPCPICDSIILKDRVGGRGTYYCKNCQKLR